MKILSYQGTPAIADINANIATIINTAKASKALNVDVLVFPELFISGYNISEQIQTLAQSLTGKVVTRLSDIAKQYDVAIICGIPECDNDRIFNSAIAIDRCGNLVGHHRKVFLFGDQEKAIFTPGDKFTVFCLNGFTCGMSICYDIEFPEAIRDLAKQEARIIFNPTANMEPYVEVPLTLARARALENGVVVVYANLCGEENELKYTGLSAIIGPDGLDIARAGNKETMLVAEINTQTFNDQNNSYSTQLSDLFNSRYYIQSQGN